MLPGSLREESFGTLWDEIALKIYEGGPHGVADTHKERLNADLLAFLGE